jgi:hypothetical protein
MRYNETRSEGSPCRVAVRAAEALERFLYRLPASLVEYAKRVFEELE